MKTYALAALAALLLASGAAGADEKQKAILEALDAWAGSVVLVEYECKQVDGKGARKFSATGVVVDAEGLVMVTDVNQVDPPVGGRYHKPETYTLLFSKDCKAKAVFLGKDEDLNLALLQWKKPTGEEAAGKKEDEPEPSFRPLRFAEDRPPGLAEEILVLRRLGKGADYRPSFALMRVTAVVEKPAGPPDYHVTGSLNGVTGCPVLALDGAVLGFVGRTSVEPNQGRSVTVGGRTFFVGRGRRGSPRILCHRDFREFLADPSKFLRRRSWLGVRGFQALNEDLAEHLGLEEEGGVILGEILERSPASRAGLRTRDIVRSVDGETLDIDEDKDLEKFTKRIERAKGGTVMSLGILRDGEKGLAPLTVRVTLEEEPTREYEVEEWEEKTFGLRVKPLTRDFLDGQRLSLDTRGVRVTYVESAGWAYLAGVRPGDIVQSVVLKKTPDVASFRQRMAEVVEAKEPEVCFNVLRGGKSLFQCVRPQWDQAPQEGKEKD